MLWLGSKLGNYFKLLGTFPYFLSPIVRKLQEIPKISKKKIRIFDPNLCHNTFMWYCGSWIGTNYTRSTTILLLSIISPHRLIFFINFYIKSIFGFFIRFTKTKMELT